MPNPIIKHITIPLPDGTIMTYDLSSISLTSTGSGNGVQEVNLVGSTLEVIYTNFLKSHPSVIKYTDTTSTSTPSFGDSFTAVDSVTRDTYGHVQKINLKTITLPTSSVTVDTALSTSSTNPVENRVVTNYKPGLVNQTTKGETFGASTSALGSYASAHGIGTIASGRYQMAIGQYNYEDADNAYAFIIGNGAQTGVTTVRSNAFTVDWGGNTTMFGNAFVKGDYIYLGPNDDITLARYDLGSNTHIDKTNMFAMAPFPSFKYQNGTNVGIVPIIGGIGTSQLTDGTGLIKVPWSRVYMRYGTTSQEGISGLYLGNSSKAGVEDNAYGELRIFTAGTAQTSSTSTNKPYIKILPPTLTGTIPNYNVYWPSRAGTLALEEYTVAGTYDSNGRVTIPNVAEIQFAEWVPDMGIQAAGVLRGGGTGIGTAVFSLPNTPNGGMLALQSDIAGYHPSPTWTYSTTSTNLSFGGTFTIDRVNQATGDIDTHGHIAHGETITYKLPSLGGGTGISIGSNGYTINHSNSVTAQTDYNKYKYKYDAQGHITSSSHWVHSASGEAGDSGWVKIASFKIIGNYFNTPITLICTHRGDRRPFQISFGFANANTKDPDLNFFELSYIPSCVSTVDTEAYLIKSATSTWNLYVLKRDSYEAFVVNDFIVGRYFTDHVTWTWTNEQTAASEITGGTGATNRMSLGMEYANNYYGMSATGDDTQWIRTTTQGILPYQSGGVNNGHSSLGTTTWRFKDAYIDEIYGTYYHGTSEYADKLSYDGGGQITPIYIVNGIPSNCKKYASGATWNIVPVVQSDGTMEIGRYVDFHSTNTGTTDYDVRLDCSDSSNLIMTSSGSSQAFTIKGVLPRFRFQQTTSDKAYSTNVLVGYPASTNGINLVMGAGGNVIIGGGEYAANFYNASKANDALDYWTDAGENTYIGADNYVMIQTNGNTIANRKSYIFGDNFNLAFGSIINFKIGNASSYHAGRLEAGTITAGRTWNLPDASGTIALTSHTHSSYLGAVNANNYYGMAAPDGTDTVWIRTTNQGIIPYEKGSAGSGHQSIGTSSWYFANAYIDDIYGTLHGTSEDVTYKTPTPSSKVTSEWNTTAERTRLVTKGWMSYWNGAYNGTSSNLTYCSQGAFGSIVTHSADDYVQTTGDTMTGNLTISKASGDTYLYTKRTDTGVEVRFGVGSSGTNHGIYSLKLGKWMVYGDASNVYINAHKVPTLDNTNVGVYKVLYTSAKAPSATSGNVTVLSATSQYIYDQYDIIKVWIYIGSTSMIQQVDICCTTEALAKAPHYFPTASSYNTKYLYFTFSASNKTYTSKLNFTTAGTSDSTKISIAKVIGVRFN